MPDMTKTISDFRGDVIVATRRLHYLAKAFSTVGNSQVADELMVIAAGLDDSAKRLADSWFGHLDDALRKSHKTLADTLRAALDRPELNDPLGLPALKGG